MPITGTGGRGLNCLQVLDSRGIPTVCAVLTTKNGTFTATVPSGTSTGKNEALELRDGGKPFNGNGVQKAVENVKKIAKHLPKNFYLNQTALDATLLHLDGTPNKSKLGANTVLAISLVAAKAAAAEKNKPLFSYFSSFTGKTPKLPIPTPTIIDGGKHGANKLSFQEFLLFPLKFSTFEQCTCAVVEVYTTLTSMLEKKFGKFATAVGLEGGESPPFSKSIDALLLIEKVIEKSGYAGRVKIGLDCAASEFYNYKTKKYNFEGKSLSPEQLCIVYRKLIDDFDIVSIEDPFEQEDWYSFSHFTRESGIQVVGDDLLTTNPTRIINGIFIGACNSLLLKPNQIGTLTEAFEAAQLARDAGWNVFASHRAGDSEDTSLADLAVGLGCEFAKIGAPTRGERTSKYNRLLFLEKFYNLKLSKPKL